MLTALSKILSKVEGSMSNPSKEHILPDPIFCYPVKGGRIARNSQHYKATEGCGDKKTGR